MEADPAISAIAISPVDLERVDRCPVCGCQERAPLHADLTDAIFEAPGVWTLYGCGGCGAAYLDPRFTPRAVHRAYTAYYTHATAPERVLGRAQRIKQALRNGYANWRYRTCYRPASPLGPLLVSLHPVQRANADHDARLLRRPRGGGRLLDVGCGNGAFLKEMRENGWDVAGLDFDPEAVRACERAGIPALVGTLEDVDLPPSSFDAVTLAHVIEHVHDPVGLLRRCRALLKPGGSLYIETPNIASHGHAHFGRAWRGLEPPRHLVIFNGTALRLACERAGLRVLGRGARAVPATFHMFQQSRAIQEGLDPNSAEAHRPWTPEQQRALKKEEKNTIRQPESAEIVMLLATRQD